MAMTPVQIWDEDGRGYTQKMEYQAGSEDALLPTGFHESGSSQVIGGQIWEPINQAPGLTVERLRAEGVPMQQDRFGNWLVPRSYFERMAASTNDKFSEFLTNMPAYMAAAGTGAALGGYLGGPSIWDSLGIQNPFSFGGSGSGVGGGGGSVSEGVAGIDYPDFAGDVGPEWWNTPDTTNWWGTDEASGVTGAEAPGGASVSGTSGVKGLASLLGVTGPAADWLDALGRAAPGLLSALASNRQAGQASALAEEFKGFGAPYRQRLSDLYANPSGFLTSPEVQVPVQQGTDMLARSLSVKGNPAGSGNALQQLQSYSADQLFGRLGQEKDRLAGFGGLANYNAAAPAAATGAITQNGKTLADLGGAMSDVFNPPKTSAQQMAEFMKMFRT